MSKNIADCRKFSPNIFNKNKCSNCFKPLFQHSKSALDSNRASRKILKCGYLFVAPDLDFSNPLYRTKRWQRRFFILYDDDELTFALDEQPGTVPQMTIDMKNVVEVDFAEKLTGQNFSIVIRTTENTTFLKGTCSEESKFWFKILSTYPKNRLKRTLTNLNPPTTNASKQPARHSQSLLIENVMKDGNLKETANIVSDKTNNNHEPEIKSAKLARPQSLNFEYTKNSQNELPFLVVRQDPDGGNCELEEELVILNNTERISQENLTSKKGWLMKLDNISNIWSKHWFSLKSGGLFFYRDQNAEKRGVLDGILDVNSLQEINEISTNRDYAFQLKSYDKKRITLSATSENIMKNWIIILKNAAGLPQICQTIDDKINNSKNLIESNSTSKNNNNNINDVNDNEIKIKTIMKLSANDCLNNKKLTIEDEIDSGKINLSSAKELHSNSLHDNINKSPLSEEGSYRTKDYKQSSRKCTSTTVNSEKLFQEDEMSCNDLRNRLLLKEKELNVMKEKFDQRETQLLESLELTKKELLSRHKENEEARDKIELENDNAGKIIAKLTEDLLNKEDVVKNLEDRLQRGIHENETLCKKLRDSGISSSSLCENTTKIRRIDSFSDLVVLNDIDTQSLTKNNLIEEYEELKQRFAKLVNELKTMKRELREAYSCYDYLDLAYQALKQEENRKKIENNSRLKLMAERIQDLTMKYSNAEKNVRVLKQKLLKSERKRTLSIKGKDLIQKEIEDKIQFDSDILSPTICSLRASPARARGTTPERDYKLRRKSLDSVSSQPLQLLVKLNALEKRTENASNNSLSTVSSVSTLRQQDIDEIDESSYSIETALSQLENQLKIKLSDLLKKRRILRESDELTTQKDLELLAERIAFECCIFGRLKDSINRLENPEKYVEHEGKSEIVEIAQLMTALKSKICGKPVNKASNSLEVLSNILTKRLLLSSKILPSNANTNKRIVTISNSSILDDLLKQQNELNMMVNRYKATTVRNIASDLAAFISTNAALQGVVQNTHSYAQDIVSAELIQAEISQVMLTAAKQYENPSIGYTITAQERNNFEMLADMANDLLQKEMQDVIVQLQECFQESLIRQERQTNFLEQENRIKLNEFADILSQKALLDARIALIRGERIEIKESVNEEQNGFNVNLMLQMENMFITLSEDLDIRNSEDIILNADFNFMFKNFVSQFTFDKEELEGVLISLEEVIHAIHNKIKPGVNLQIQNLNLDNIKNISLKLNEFQGILQSIKNHETDKNMVSEEEFKEVLEKLEKVENLCNEKNKENNELSVKLDSTTKNLQKEKEKVAEIEKDYDYLQKQLSARQNHSKKLEKHLELIESNYKDKIDQLHQHYQNKLKIEATEKDTEEQIRQKYQEEIEQLRTLCEKGLKAMEVSHKRIISELETKHRGEIQRLLYEKEIALNEETQATIQALDAMKKAHQNEVKKEIQRFKQDFIRKFNNKDLDLYKELEDVRQEIMSLSERYSLKCVEIISLEEKLKVTEQKLKSMEQTYGASKSVKKDEEIILPLIPVTILKHRPPSMEVSDFKEETPPPIYPESKEDEKQIHSFELEI